MADVRSGLARGVVFLAGLRQDQEGRVLVLVLILCRILDLVLGRELARHGWSRKVSELFSTDVQMYSRVRQRSGWESDGVGDSWVGTSPKRRGH